MAKRTYGKDERRFWAKVTILPNGCGEWADRLTTNGYAFFSVGGKRVRAHRWAYEHFVGPIPEGLDVDHLCHNADESCRGGTSCPHRQCPIPDHLAPSTRQENLKRGRAGEHMRGKTHCKWGHPFDEANTYVSADGHRHCRACALRRSRLYYKPAAKRTHCKNGHAYEGNVYEYRGEDGTIVRICKTCHHATQAAYRARKKAG